jgi:hypothetical protein
MNYLKPFFAIAVAGLVFFSCSNLQKTATPAVHILPRSSWDAMPPKNYKTHIPVRITIHHEGTKLEVQDDAAKKINAIQRWGMGAEKNWADIPYHYLIAPNGTIYEGRNVYTVGETSTEYDPTGHLLICCLGNLEEQLLPPQQLQSLIGLTAYAANQFKISTDSIASHRDYSMHTTCPGKNLYPYIQNGFIQKEVKKLLKH